MADRAARRTSRVTPSEFDSLLRSNETVMFSEGRDENLLGLASRTRDADGSLDNTAAELNDRPAAAAPPTPPPKAAARTASVKYAPPPKPVSPISFKSPKLVANQEVKRRSMYRSPGTASSPDLASLVRKAKEASEKHTSPVEQDELAEAALEIRPVLDERAPLADGPPPLAPAVETAASPVSPPRAVQPRRLTSPASSPPPPLRTPAVPPPVPAAAAASTGLAIPGLSEFDPSANPRKQRMSVISNSSYVHVPPSPVPPSRSDSPLRRRASKGTPDLSTLDVGSSSPPSRKSRPGSLLSKQEDEQKVRAQTVDGEMGCELTAIVWAQSSFSNTMRKTSRFFKRLGAGSPSSAKVSSLF